MELLSDIIKYILNTSSLYIYFLVTFILIFMAYRYLTIKSYNLPPGPWSLPLIGNYKEAVSNKNYIIWAEDLRKKYGDVVLIHEGSQPSVIVNDYDTAVEALVTKYPKELAGRPTSTLMEAFSENYNDMLASNYGPLWKKERKLTHGAFRKFMSGTQIEVANINSFVKFSENIPLDTPIDPTESLYQLTFNIIFSVLFGKTYSLDDKEFLYITTLMREANAIFNNVLYVEVLPILYHFPLPYVKKFKNNVNNFHDFIKKKIKEHEDSLGAYPRDVCDSLLMEARENAENFNEDAINEIHVRQILSDLIFGGSDTTRLTLTWIIGLLAVNPPIQDRMYQEIRSYKETLVKGNDEVSLDWKNHLPYTSALINESLRYGSIAPKTMHTSMADCKIGGYDVPKGYNVYTNIYGFHHDQKYWQDPHTFKPERFLDENGQLIPKVRGFSAFSFGPRVCVGESVAKANLFLLTVQLCSTFEFIWDESNPKRVIEEADGSNFDRFPAPYKVKLHRRQ